jgi:hypothetical protein
MPHVGALNSAGLKNARIQKVVKRGDYTALGAVMIVE